MMNIPGIILVFGLEQILLLFLWRWFFHRVKTLRLIKETPVDAPRQVADGEFVAVKGRVTVEGEALTAPISRKQAVFYASTVTRGGGESEVTYFKERKAIPFFLGSADRGLKVELQKNVSNRYKLWPKEKRACKYEDLHDDLKAQFKRKPAKFLKNLTYNCMESGIEVGQELVLYGYVQNGVLAGSAGKRLYIQYGDQEGFVRRFQQGNIALGIVTSLFQVSILFVVVYFVTLL